MGYKNFSEICPIFNTDNTSGVEHEVTFPVRISSTITTWPILTWNPGREVVLMEAFMIAQASDGLSTAISCTVQIASDQSASAYIGSIAFGCAEMSDRAGAIRMSGSVTSTALTSTDIISVWIVNEANNAIPGWNESITLRYRDK